MFTPVPALPSKYWAYADYIGMLSRKETHSKPPEITVSHNFIGRKVKQNDKTKEFILV